MTTSLAQQLKKLAVPETSIYRQEKKKTSLLFDPKEAASIDRETFYEIGLSGLAELKKINPCFADYEHTLFSLSSKEFERSIQTKDANKKIDKSVKSFLIKLSPYFLLQSSHKALEWLINRFHIHKYNKDDFFRLILPYHETRIFVRCLQIMKIEDATDMWNWLEPLQKPGIPLAKPVLYNHCASNPSFLAFISDMVKKAVKEFDDTADLLSTLFAFYCSSVVGALEYARSVTEAHVTNILPDLLKCLPSSIDNLRAAAYMILAQLVAKTQLNAKVMEHLVDKISIYQSNLQYESVLLLNLMFQTQEKLTTVSEKFLSNLSPDDVKVICLNLNMLISEGIDVSHFLIAFMSGVLSLLQQNVENLKRFANIPELFVSEIHVNSASAGILIKCVVDCYSTTYQTTTSQGEDADSDMEVIEEDSVEFIKIQAWYSNFLKGLELKYPNEFDNIVRDVLKSNKSTSNKQNALLNEILGFAPKLIKKLGDSFLFEKLYHQNSDIRREAVKYLISDMKNLKKSNIDFVKESIADRLRDDDPGVIEILLDIELQGLIDLAGRNILISQLRLILGNGHKDTLWWQPCCKALKYLCALEESLSDLTTCMAILPYLFPKDKQAAIATVTVMKSPLGKKIMPGLDVQAVVKNKNPKSICKIVFDALRNGSWLPNTADLMQIINSKSLEENYNSKMFALLLITFSLKNDNSSSESLQILNAVSQFIENANVKYIRHPATFSSEFITDFIEISGNGQLPLQTYVFFLEQIIAKTKIHSFKPWSITEDVVSDRDFVSKMYDLLVKGCSSKLEKAYSPVLRALINSVCSTIKEKMEFVTNFTVDYSELEDDNQQIENQHVTQFRSLRILQTFLLLSEEDLDWILDSNIILFSLILSLYSRTSSIRATVLEIIKVICAKVGKQEHHFYFLFNELLRRREEILADQEQVPLVLYALLSPDPEVRKHLIKPLVNPMKKSLDYLVKTIVSESTPYTIKAKMTSLISLINSGEILSAFSAIALKLIETNHENDHLSNAFESRTLCNVISRIDAASLKSAQNDMVWKLMDTSLKNIKKTEWNNVYVCVLVMQQIDQELFDVLPQKKAEALVSQIIVAGTFGSDSSVISCAAKLIKRINLDAKHVVPTLASMHDITDRNHDLNSRKKSKPLMPSLLVLDTVEWKSGVTLLEYMQNKKKLTGIDEILPNLFSILKKCLDFEEQSPVEYVKQLLLTSILHCSQKMYPSDRVQSKKIPQGIMDIELIVMCIRGTQNPQTHHHALMLLSQAASMLPDQVLHHMMAIFTFIGSSVLRQDDAYSFQIITKIIETVIPILVKSESLGNDLDQLEKRVIPVLRIFVDVVMDVPEHRRLPLFKKLLLTLNPELFLSTFLNLMFESHIMHGIEEKTVSKVSTKEQPVRRLDFAMSLVSEFPPDVIMQSCIKLVGFLKTLPLDKEDENIGKQVKIDPTALFEISSHSSKQLRHFKYTVITFVNNVLSTNSFIQQINSLSDKGVMEDLYKSFIVNILTYIQVVSKAADQNIGKPQAKYWKVMLHHSYEILDNVNILLSVEMFIMVVRGLMTHNLPTVRRKSMEILNTKLQHHVSFFADCDKYVIYSLLEPLLEIIGDINSNNEIPDGLSKQEVELNQQTALLSLKLLVRLLAQEDPMKFKPILDLITNLTRSTVSGNLMASIVLCLAELCSNLKAHAIAYLPKFMPSLIKILKTQRSAGCPELVLLSVITAICKIVETIPLFLSPYLEKLLFEFSILTAKWESVDSAIKNTPVISKLMLIKNKISSTIAPRVLIPVIIQCYGQLIKKDKFSAIGPAMNILSESFVGISGPEFTSLQQELSSFFLSALQFRCDCKDDDDKLVHVDAVEEHVIKAVISLVLKLSESSFRPLYFKIFDWAVRMPDDDNNERAITFYRLSYSIAENLKGLFILFAGHFIKNAADLLNACNKNKSEDFFLDSDEKCCDLIEYVVKTLNAVFLYDSQNFVNKERFETIMQPLVDQLDNDIGGMDALKIRAKKLIIPCIAQFSVATADDSLWKPLNYQILLKTRHNDFNIRLLGLDCMCEMATKLGDSWLPLLPESVPFLAELLEDEVQNVEAATQKAVQTLEVVLGEPLQKYF